MVFAAQCSLHWYMHIAYDAVHKNANNRERKTRHCRYPWFRMPIPTLYIWFR